MPAAKKNTNSLTVLAERQEVEITKRVQAAKKVAKYIIQSPDEARNSPDAEITTQLHIHPGPAIDPETGEPTLRDGGIVELIRGIGYTENPLWAAYLQEQWGVTEGRPKGLLITKLNPFTNRREEFKYLNEVEKLRALIDGETEADEEADGTEA